GQSGYLDHALASPGLADQVTGAAEWHINADEPVALDYNLEFKSANQQTTFYDPGPYRASDHDPLVVGLDLTVSLADTSPARLFLGLRNDDDQGTRFDVRVVLRANGTPVTEGEAFCVTGITKNPSKALELAVPFGPVAANTLQPGDVLAFDVLTRIGTNPDGSRCGGHKSAMGLRLYYDAVSPPSQLGGQIAPGPLLPYYLHANATSFFFDTTAPVAATPKQKDSAPITFAGGNPWKSVGTWSRTVP